MFVRQKRVGGYTYLQLVENSRVDGKSRQRVVATLGRADVLEKKGSVDALLCSLGRFADKVKVQEAYEKGSLSALGEHTVGPSLVFGRLWEELGLREILEEKLSGRKFSFPVERAVLASTVHRLFESGSDRQGHRFLRDVAVPCWQRSQSGPRQWMAHFPSGACTTGATLSMGISSSIARNCKAFVRS